MYHSNMHVSTQERSYFEAILSWVFPLVRLTNKPEWLLLAACSLLVRADESPAKKHADQDDT